MDEFSPFRGCVRLCSGATKRMSSSVLYCMTSLTMDRSPGQTCCSLRLRSTRHCGQAIAIGEAFRNRFPAAANLSALLMARTPPLLAGILFGARIFRGLSAAIHRAEKVLSWQPSLHLARPEKPLRRRMSPRPPRCSARRLRQRCRKIVLCPRKTLSKGSGRYALESHKKMGTLPAL
jgi:hypothetical protein